MLRMSKHGQVQDSAAREHEKGDAWTCRKRGLGPGKIDGSSAKPESRGLESFGHFAAQVRQTRRKIRRRFEMRAKRLSSDGFNAKQVLWPRSGQFACRHGVLFARPHLRGCPCMQMTTRDDAARWQHARFMPALDHDLKALVAVQFDLSGLQRLGQLQAEMRRLHYI